jgi:uncharacterized integral membrane protein
MSDATPDTGKKKSKMSLLPKLRIAALAVAGILLVFVVSKNWKPTEVDLILLQSEMPVAILIILTFLFGIGVGVLLAFLRPWKRKS